MADRNQDSAASEALDDFFEPVIGDLSDDDMQELLPVSS